MNVFLGIPYIFYLGNNSTVLGASYWVGRLPDEGDVQIEWMTGVLCNGLICQQVSSKKELNILPRVLAKDTFFSPNHMAHNLWMNILSLQHFVDVKKVLKK